MSPARTPARRLDLSRGPNNAPGAVALALEGRGWPFIRESKKTGGSATSG
jgi:hypothetical protein